jgi:hypothetical protein
VSLSEAPRGVGSPQGAIQRGTIQRVRHLPASRCRSRYEGRFFCLASCRDIVCLGGTSHGYELTGRQLSANHLQRGQQLQRYKPQRESLRLELAGASRTYCLPRLNLVSKFPPSCIASCKRATKSCAWAKQARRARSRKY